MLQTRTLIPKRERPSRVTAVTDCALRSPKDIAVRMHECCSGRYRAASQKKVVNAMTRGLPHDVRIRERWNSISLDAAHTPRRWWVFCALFIGVACSSGGTGDVGQSAATGGAGTYGQTGGLASGSGGVNSSGGATASGMSTAAGGKAAVGGTVGAGGHTGLAGSTSGGLKSSAGGTSAMGGSAMTGGAVSLGGHAATGGATTSGGSSGKAGASSSGGSTAVAIGGGANGGTGGALTTSTVVNTGQATYFVSPDGSDGNPGTLDAPFQTLSRARDVVRTVNANMSGDIYVYLRGGNYSIASAITFGTQDSGTNGHRIYYLAYPGETPVLNGATKVTGWTVHSGNIYQAALNRTTKLRNLYVNDVRANMTSKTVTAKAANGTYSVTSGQADWAWASGSGFDGVEYGTSDVPAITSNKDDLEIVNRTTWNENIVCVRDVVTASDGNRGLMLQQPYGAIAQLPGWSSGFAASGSHTIFNVFAWLTSPGQFYFDKTAGTLYYYPRAGEDMSTADVEAPVVESLLDIAGTSNASQDQEHHVPRHHLREHGLQPLQSRELLRQGERTGGHCLHCVRYW